MANECPYVNRLSGDTLQGYSDLKQFLIDVVKKDGKISLERFWASVGNVFMEGDFNVIKKFCDATKDSDPQIAKGDRDILYLSSKVGAIYSCGDWKADVSEGTDVVIGGVSLDFLDNPTIVTKNVIMRAKWYSECEPQIQKNIEYFSQILKGVGVKGGISKREIKGSYKDGTPRDGFEYSISIEVPPYTDKDVKERAGGIRNWPGQNILDRIENPNLSFLEQLVNAMHVSVDILRQLNRK